MLGFLSFTEAILPHFQESHSFDSWTGARDQEMEEANSEEEYRGSISEEECNQLEATSSAAKRRRRGIQENMVRGAQATARF